MVRPDEYLKVLDFGLAKRVEPSSPDLDARLPIEDCVNTQRRGDGKARCMSPDQVLGENADARADISSLGVVFYEMITGRAPFTGATRNDVIASILKDEPTPLATVAPETPPELGRIVCKVLQRNRVARYQILPDLISDLM